MYIPVINTTQGLSTTDQVSLIGEFNLLRAELDDMRAKYAATVALLTAGTAVGAGYAAGTALAAKQFVPT